MTLLLIIATLALSVLACTLTSLVLLRQTQSQKQLHELQQHRKHADAWFAKIEERTHHHQDMVAAVFQLLNDQQLAQQQQRAQFDQHQIHTLKTLQETLQNGMADVRRQVTESLTQHATTLTQRVEKINQTTDQRLQEISGQVEKRLSEGFEKTTATFTDVIKRLALIDEAQKKITELSTNVVSLQEVLVDKKARGAFGEVQLIALIRNVMPEQSFAFQHTLSNGKRADCILFLPEPTGHIAIDAKFPLETFRHLMDGTLSDFDRKTVEQNFRKDIKKHIQDISERYIIPNETSDGAMMFIPAESIFAEIHSHYSDLVEMAQKARVWMVSPTTMVAVLTTAKAVLKDAATRKQVHIIQEHLVALGKDFDRFQERMDKLAKNIKLAHENAEEVHISSRKISSRFNKIESVDLEDKSAQNKNNSVALLETEACLSVEDT